MRGRESDRPAHRGHQHHVVILVRDAGIDQADTIGQFHGDLAVRLHVGEIRQRVPPHVPVRGREHDLQAVPFVLGHVHRHQRGDRGAAVDGQDVDQRLALGGAPAQGQPPGLEAIDHAVGGEEQQLGMGVGNEERRHHVVVLGRHRRQALAAPALAAELDQRGALDVAARGDGHDHVLALDQVLVVHVAGPFGDLGAARDGEKLFHLAQFVRDDAHDPLARGEDCEVVADRVGKRAQLVRDFLHAKRGQALQAQFKDRAGLRFGQVVGAVVVHRVLGIVDQLEVFEDLGRGPAPFHQPLARVRRIGRGADRRHDLVHVGHGHGKAAQDVAALARAAQFERGAAGDDFLAEGDEVRQEPAQGQLFGAAAVQRQHVGPETRLHGREAVKLVQHHVGRGVAAQFDHQPHAVAVGFVLDVADPLDLLFLGQFRDPLDQRRLVDLVGDVVQHDGLAVVADILDPGAGAHDDRPAPFEIGFPRARTAKDDAAGGEVGAGDDFQQPLGRQVRIGDQFQRGVDDLAQVVGRDVGGHPNGDAARAVDEHVGKPRRQHGRFAVLAVVVVLELDRVLVDVGQHPVRRLGHTRLGIAHCRGRIAVHRAEIALPVEQRQRHGKILRHPHQRVVDRGIAVRVVFPHHVADRARGLAVGLVEGVPGLVHREQDPAVDRLQTVAQVRDRAADDHRHGVVEIGGLHLGRDVDHRPVMGHHAARRRLARPGSGGAAGGIVFGHVVRGVGGIGQGAAPLYLVGAWSITHRRWVQQGRP